MMKSFYFMVVCFVFFMCVSCGSSMSIIYSKKLNNGYTINILSESLWEHNKTYYYQIIKDGSIVVRHSFVEIFGNSNRIEIKTINDIIYAIDTTKPNVVIIIHRMTDDASWPNSDIWADELIVSVQKATNNKKLQLSSRITNY